MTSVTFEQLLILIAIGTGLTLYVLLGGADFGGGVWDLLARGPMGKRQRDLISEAIGPVWEANHVWLIFVITGLFAAFPPAFAALSIALYLPFSIALIGIVFRGAAFAFRFYGKPDSAWQRAWTTTFGVASTITPLALGACAGAISSGRIRVDGEKVSFGLFAAWTGPLSILSAVLALAVSAYLAANYLCVEAKDRSDRPLEESFRIRALACGMITGALAGAGLIVVETDAPVLWEGMLARGLPFAVISAAGGIASMAAAYRRRYDIARAGAAVAVAAVLAGWGAAQWPLLIVPDVSITEAAAPQGALGPIAFGLLIGGTLLAPSLWYLFKIFKDVKTAS